MFYYLFSSRILYAPDKLTSLNDQYIDAGSSTEKTAGEGTPDLCLKDYIFTNKSVQKQNGEWDQVVVSTKMNSSCLWKYLS